MSTGPEDRGAPPTFLHVVWVTEAREAERLLAAWKNASRRPDELVVGSPFRLDAPGSIEARDLELFLESANRVVRDSSCSWVSFSLGEGQLRVDRFARLLELLQRAPRARACWFQANVPDGHDALALAMIDAARVPCAEEIAFHRRWLVEGGGLDASCGALAPWSAFLGLAGSPGHVQLWREEVSASLPRSADDELARALRALSNEARRTGESPRGAAPALIELELARRTPSLLPIVADLRGRFEPSTDLVDRPSTLAPSVAEALVRLWRSSSQREAPTRSVAPLWVVRRQEGLALATGREHVAAKLGAPVVHAPASLRVRRGDAKLEDGRLRCRDASWVELVASVVPGKAHRVRVVLESKKHVSLRFSWDRAAASTELRFPLQDRWRLRVGPGVRLTTDDDLVVYDAIASSHSLSPAEDRFIASESNSLRIGIYADDPDSEFIVSAVIVAPLEHEGTLALRGASYELVGATPLPKPASTGPARLEAPSTIRVRRLLGLGVDAKPLQEEASAASTVTVVRDSDERLGEVLRALEGRGIVATGSRATATTRAVRPAPFDLVCVEASVLASRENVRDLLAYLHPRSVVRVEGAVRPPTRGWLDDLGFRCEGSSPLLARHASPIWTGDESVPTRPTEIVSGIAPESGLEIFRQGRATWRSPAPRRVCLPDASFALPGFYGAFSMWHEEFELLSRYVGKGKTYLEVGSLCGVTIAYLVRAYPHLETTCVDAFMEGHATQGGVRALFELNRGLASPERIRVVEGLSHVVMPTLAADSFDTILIDADHSYASVTADAKNAWRLCRTGGHVLFHDYSFVDGTTRAVDEFVKQTPGVVALEQQGGLLAVRVTK